MGVVKIEFITRFYMEGAYAPYPEREDSENLNYESSMRRSNSGGGTVIMDWSDRKFLILP